MEDYLSHIIAIIEGAVERKNTNISKVSNEAVGNHSMIRNMKLGKSPRVDNLKKLCDVLDLELYIGLPEEYPGLNTKVPLVGKSKGEELVCDFDISTLNNNQLKDCEYVDAPINKGSIIAFAIEDNNLFPIFSAGDMVFADLDDKCVALEWEQFIGKACVVRLQDGNSFLCVLRRGDAPEMFNLESLTGKPTSSNQLPACCLPIRWVRKVNG